MKRVKRDFLKRRLSLAIAVGVLALNFAPHAFAGSEAGRQNSSSAKTENSRSVQTNNSSSAANQSHSGASLDSGRITSERSRTAQRGIKTASSTRSSVRHRRPSNNSRSYMLNTIQQAARTK